MDNHSTSATPEQKLYTLTNEILTPIHTIRGFAQLLKMDIETAKLDSHDLVKKVNKIIEAADKIEKFRNEALG